MSNIAEYNQAIGANIDAIVNDFKNYTISVIRNETGINEGLPLEQYGAELELFLAPPTVPGMPIINSPFDSEFSLKNLESFGKKTDEPTFISKLSVNVNSSNLGVSTFP